MDLTSCPWRVGGCSVSRQRINLQNVCSTVTGVAPRSNLCLPVVTSAAASPLLCCSPPTALLFFALHPSSLGCRAAASTSTKCAVTEAEELTPADQQQQQQQQWHQPHSDQTSLLLHELHGLCDGQDGFAPPEQLQAWAKAAQVHLSSMSLSEVAYMASCFRHHKYHCHHRQQQDASMGDAAAAAVCFAAPVGFLQQVCAAACAAANSTQLSLQHSTHQPHETHHTYADALQQLLDLLLWSADEVVQRRRTLQQQLHNLQEQVQVQVRVRPQEAADAADVQGYRQQLDQQVMTQQAAQQLLQHPLLLAALPHANCWQLQQLLVCARHLGHTPRFDWMGQWLAAARHIMADMAVTYTHPEALHNQQQQQQQHGTHWQEHVEEHRAAAAAAYLQLVGLLSGLATTQVKPPDAWLDAWQQAALAVLAARPCFNTLDGHDGTSSSSSSSSSSLFSTLQQLLQAVWGLKLRLSQDFWAAHEGMLQVHLMSFSPHDLLRLLQLHQQFNLRPSRAFIKYLTALLEQHLEQHWVQQQQQHCAPDEAACSSSGCVGREPCSDAGSSSSSMAGVLQSVMCACGLSVWGVRHSLRCVGQLVLLLEAHRTELPLMVVLQVMSMVGTSLARVYAVGCAPTAANSFSSFSSFSSSSSSSSSMSSVSTDGDEAPGLPPDAAAAAAVAAPATPAAAAAAIERLLLYAARRLAAQYVAHDASNTPHATASHNSSNSSSSSSSSSSSGDSTLSSDDDEATVQTSLYPGSGGDSTGSSSSQAAAALDGGPLLKLLQVASSLARNSSRASSSHTLTSTAALPSTAAAAAAAVASSSGPGGAFLDHLAHALHPACAAAALTCSPAQLVELMGAWNQLGFSAAWRFGGFRRAYKRLGRPEVLRCLSNAQLAAAVEAVAPLPPVVSVVEAVAAEVVYRQTAAPQQRPAGAGSIADGPVAAARVGGEPAAAAAAAGVSRLSSAQLLAVVCAVPSLHPTWPASVTLLLLQQLAGSIHDGLSPSQQWRLWNALHALQQQWKPAVVAAASAAAAAAASSTVGPNSLMHPMVSYAAAAAAAASLKSPAATAAVVVDSSISISRASCCEQAWQQQGSQQQLMLLLDCLQDQVAAALARVQPDPDALPLEAAPPKVPGPLHAQSASDLDGSNSSSSSSVQPTTGAGSYWAREQEGQCTQQQVLAAFAKAQKSLLNPACNGAVLVKVLEGLVVLLSVPRYAKAARKNEAVQRAVLRTMEAAAWPDLLAQALDLQQLLLLMAVSAGLEAPPDSPYSQLLLQEATRVLADTPLRTLAATLGRLAALRLPGFKVPEMVLLRFWVGRLAQAARDSPEDALAVVVPLTQIGFRPAAGAASLVLQPLLDAAAAAAPDAQRSSSSSSRDSQGLYPSDASSSSSSAVQAERQVQSSGRLSAPGVLALTRVCADMGLLLDASNTHTLLSVQIRVMQHFNVTQLLQLARDVFTLGLLTPSAAPAAAHAGAAAAAAAGGGSGSARAQGGASAVARAVPLFVPLGGEWVATWLQQLLFRGTVQMSTAQVIELQLLLCELDCVPWSVSHTHSGAIHAALQQLDAKLAPSADSWQQPLAAAITAAYHSTQELRRLVAARARAQAHQQALAATPQWPRSSSSSSSSAISGAAAAAGGAAVLLAGRSSAAAGAGASDAGGSGCAEPAASGTRQFVSRKAAAAAAAATRGGGVAVPGAGAGAGGGAQGGFSYARNALQQQLVVLGHQKKVLLWAAIKHRAVGELTAHWVESCCLNILVGHHYITPTVASGLLLSVSEVHSAAATTSSSRSGGGSAIIRSAATAAVAPAVLPDSAAAAAAAAAAGREAQALVNITSELVGWLLNSLPSLRGGVFVQAVASLAAARVAAPTRTPQGGAVAAAAAAAAPPLLHELSQKQQRLLLSVVSHKLPYIHPRHLPLLVNSFVALRLRPDAAWLSAALHCLAAKAAGAAAAGGPAEQLLLLAAAKQLLVCGDVLLLPEADAAAAGPGMVQGLSTPQQQQQVANRGSRPSAVASAVLPVRYALRALAAGAAQVLGSIFKGAQLHGPLQGGGATAPPAAAAAPGLPGPAAAGSGGVHQGKLSVALLLSSLATQLTLAQAAGLGTLGTAAETAGLQPLLSPPGQSSSTGLAVEQALAQQRQLLAAAVLVTAGSGGVSPVGGETAAARAVGTQTGRYGVVTSSRGQQQQQQRVLLGQLLQLQLLKASEGLVQSVWAQRGATTLLPRQQGAAVGVVAGLTQATGTAAPATVLLAPTPLQVPSGGGSSTEQPRQQQQELPLDDAQERQQDEGTGGAEAGTSTTPRRLNPRPSLQQLVTRGLQVQFDGLLRKAFMAAAAAAAAGSSSQEQGSEEWAGEAGGDAAAAAAAARVQRAARRGPWWLPLPRSSVTGLMQQAAPEGPTGDASSSSSSSSDGRLMEPAASEAVGPAAGGGGGAGAGGEGDVGPGRVSEPVLLLPVMSRALDAQFARLMREVLHSSLAAGSGRTGGS